MYVSLRELDGALEVEEPTGESARSPRLTLLWIGSSSDAASAVKLGRATDGGSTITAGGAIGIVSSSS